MRSKQKIAFIKRGDFSYINTSVHQILVSNFPDFQVDVIELDHLINDKDRLAVFYCLKEYGKDILIDRVKELLLDGYVWTIESDITDCFPSFEGGNLHSCLPLPEKVIQINV